MKLSDQARAIAQIARYVVSGSRIDLLDLRASLLARWPHSGAARVLARVITHRVREQAERD